MHQYAIVSHKNYVYNFCMSFWSGTDKIRLGKALGAYETSLKKDSHIINHYYFY